MWKTLFSIEIGSLVSVAIVFIFAFALADKFGWYILTFVVFSGYSVPLFLLLLVISIIVRVIQGKKINAIINYKKSNGIYIEENAKPSILKAVAIVAICLMTTLSVEIISFNTDADKRQTRYNNDLSNAKSTAINYLTKKYGEGNFTIAQDITATNSFSGSMDDVSLFDFTITTDYMEDDFQVTVNRNTSKVTDYEFLEKYYHETQGIEDLENYLCEYKIKELNEELSKRFNSTISFISTEADLDNVKCYGSIPQIDQLAEYVTFVDPRFDIKEDIKSYEELTEYLEDLTRYFITEICSEKIVYNSYTEYFRYKFDFTKLGDEDYTDQYDGYGGYVMSGEYKYSDEKGCYEKINADTIVRIYNTRRIEVYTIDEILGIEE